MGALNRPIFHKSGVCSVWLLISLFIVTIVKFGHTQFVTQISDSMNGKEIDPPRIRPSRRMATPPLITKQPPKTVYFREFERIELPCEASGEPTPSYQWQMNERYFDPNGNINFESSNERISIKPGVGTLIFHRPLDRDDGIYQCFASNPYGVALSVKINFRLARLEPFMSSGIMTNYPNVGDSLRLICPPPLSFPRASVFWAIESEGKGYIPLNMSDRISQDLDGNLNFVNIVPEDSRNGYTYACIAQNSVTRSSQQGEYHQIYPRGQQAHNHPPTIMWQSPTLQRAYLGGSISFKCIFSGNPTPRVDWVRDQGVMPARARQESFGQQLTIDNVQYEDAGKYECQGINDEAMVPIRKYVILIVESEPWWIQKPQSVDAAEGENATFYCEAQSLPAPRIFWSLNGHSLYKLPQNRRRIVTTNSLTFLNVTQIDTVVIQCNVTNRYGYNFTNAYLNIHNEPPFVLDPPMVGQKGATGQKIKLRCKMFGSPKPKIVWKKNNTELTGERFLVLEDGSLQISHLSLVDTGEYTCTGTSRLGYAEATGSLTVQRKRAKNKADKQLKKCKTNKRRCKQASKSKAKPKKTKKPKRRPKPISNNEA